MKNRFRPSLNGSRQKDGLGASEFYDGWLPNQSLDPRP